MKTFIKKCLRYAKRKVGIVDKTEIPVEKKTRQDCNYEGRNYIIPIETTRNCKGELLASETPQIAIQVHLFFEELADEVLQYVNKIPFQFDCYISTDSWEKKKVIEQTFEGKCKANNVFIDIIENKGRDVAPFLQQMSNVYEKYKYIGHIHTKKSKHTEFGDGWRNFLYWNLLGSDKYIETIFSAFEENEALGMIMPEIYPLIQEFVAWDGAKEGVEEILNKMNLKTELPEVPMFPAGNMFWARTEAIAPILKLGYTTKDFPNEEGQLNLTLAHCIERIWVYLLKAQGFSYEVWENLIQIDTQKKVQRIFIHANSENGNSIEENWLEKLKKYSVDELEKYDQFVFINDDYIGPWFDLNIAFARMENKTNDCWNIMKAVMVINNRELIHEISEKGFSILNEKKYKCDNYILEQNCLKELLYVQDAEKDVSYEVMILGSPFLHKEFASNMQKNEKIRLKYFLKKLKNYEKYKEQVEKFWD